MFRIEPLESRTLFTAYVVDTLADTVAADGFVSLREAITAANTNAISGDAVAGSGAGDTISFDAGLANGTIVLGGTALRISDDLVIDGGANNLTIDANALSQVLVIDVGLAEDVTVRNLVLTNGRGATGGAVSILGDEDTDFTFENVDITNSVAAGSGGGAIYMMTGQLDIRDSVITGNMAIGSGNSNGGAIRIDRDANDDISDLNIFDSVISGNFAHGNGGGIWSVAGDMNLIGSTLSGNATFGASAGSGGGLFFTGQVTFIEGSTISDNSALDSSQAGGGGGIFTSGFLQISENSVITRNGAYDANGVGGGGIAINSDQVLIFDAQISENVAVEVGGGVAVANASDFTANRNVLIEGNQSGGPGGGIHVDATSQVNLGGSNAVSNAGVIIRGNASLNSHGGGVFADGGGLDMNHVHVSFNFAGDSGGGIFARDVANLHLMNTQIFSNLAINDGGGIHANMGSMNFMQIYGNTAGRDGGGVFVAAGLATGVTNAGIYDNAAGQRGGGIFNDGVLTLNIDDVFRNDAGLSGGGLYHDGTFISGPHDDDDFHDNTPDDIVGV